LLLVATYSFAQRTLFTLPMGDDTLLIKGDACLWTRGYMLMSDSQAVKNTEATFARAYGFVGATVQYGKHAYARYYYDLGEVNGKPAYDLIAGLTCCNFDFRFGQLKLPLGYEVICAPWKMDFIENSLAAGYRTPTAATRDIGAMLSYSHRYFQTALAIVNGNGRNNVGDNNPQKDIAFRLVGTPFGKPTLTLGGNLYWGNDINAVKDKPRPFHRMAAEATWLQPSYFARGEFLYGTDTLGAPDSLGAPTRRNINGFYVAGGFRTGHFQPVLRFERFTLSGNTTSTLAFGVNGFWVNDMIKPMLDVSLIRDGGRKIDYAKVMFQIQAAFW
jgi:hypothetical protein